MKKICTGVALLGTIVTAGVFFGGCGSSSDENTVSLNGYTFNSDSATLTNKYFPVSEGDTIKFKGEGSFLGSSYTWTLSAGETVEGVATLHEVGIVTNASGESYTVFDSMLAQDTDGNVHVLKDTYQGVTTVTGVAAELAPTILVLSDPKVGDAFGPTVNYIGEVVALDESVDSYTNVLQTRFIVNQADSGQNQYDDFWAPGVGPIKSSWLLADGTNGSWIRVE